MGDGPDGKIMTNDGHEMPSWHELRPPSYGLDCRLGLRLFG